MLVCRVSGRNEREKQHQPAYYRAQPCQQHETSESVRAAPATGACAGGGHGCVRYADFAGLLVGSHRRGSYLKALGAAGTTSKFHSVLADSAQGGSSGSRRPPRWW
eukprot:COSAG04_NODE_13042_length_622_cov_2.476099_1_plen_105_part_01